MNIRNNYNHTLYACYIGYITQAIINNFVPLLFLTFAMEFRLSLPQITLFTTFNFLTQLTVDLLSARFADRIGYRPLVIMAHAFSAGGLMALTFLPQLFSNPYAGIMLSVFIYSIGGGLIEVMISPIVEACPTEKKEAAMSLLHSFYCWGHMAVIILSTLFFSVFTVSEWRVLAWLWALVPFINIFYFSLVPIQSVTGNHEPMSVRSLFSRKIFWLLFIIMICAGAAEQAMSQWASAFAESGLGVSKTVGDLAGPCMFAFFMGTSRALYAKNSDRISLINVMILSSVFCIGAYILAAFSSLPLLALAGCALCGLAVGIFWPGTFSVAASVLPSAGTAMYAFLALAGDVGCALGPTIVGFTAGFSNGSLQNGLAAAILFPLLIFAGMMILKHKRKG